MKKVSDMEISPNDISVLLGTGFIEHFLNKDYSIPERKYYSDLDERGEMRKKFEDSYAEDLFNYIHKLEIPLTKYPKVGKRTIREIIDGFKRVGIKYNPYTMSAAQEEHLEEIGKLVRKIRRDLVKLEDLVKGKEQVYKYE